MTSDSENIDFDLRIAEFRINGYAVLENVLSVETVDRIREAFLPMLEHVKGRESGIAEKEWGTCALALAASRSTIATP